MTAILVTTSATSRVLTVIRRWYRDHGMAPSYREIDRQARVGIGRVREHLDRLQAMGVLTHRKGVPCSIELVDRLANVSDDELERACHGRSWTVIRPPAVASALGEAYPLPTGTDCPADLMALLVQIDPAAARPASAAARVEDGAARQAGDPGGDGAATRGDSGAWAPR